MVRSQVAEDRIEGRKLRSAYSRCDSNCRRERTGRSYAGSEAIADGDAAADMGCELLSWRVESSRAGEQGGSLVAFVTTGHLLA